MDSWEHQRLVSHYVTKAIHFGEISWEQVAEGLNLTLSGLRAKLSGAKDWTFADLLNLYFIGIQIPGFYRLEQPGEVKYVSHLHIGV